MGSIAPSTIETEGRAPFKVPGVETECFTWYKIHGDLNGDITPLVIIHGGPGLTHDYLRSLSALTTTYSIPIVLYDQLGNGRSTHLRETVGDESFWTEALLHKELANLITHLGLDTRGYDLLGHSWGGMMGSTFAGTSPKGLRKLIIGNAPADSKSWSKAYYEYRAAMPAEIQKALTEGEEKADWEGAEYEAAITEFMKKHCCTTDPWPEEFLETFEWASKDPTVGLTMGGPSEFIPMGSIKDWTALDIIEGIKVPTLIINGVNEGASDEGVRPFVEGIKEVKWVKLQNSTHMPIYEEREKYLKTLGEFLLE